MTMATEATAETAAGLATDSQIDRPTGADATIGIIAVGETTPETMRVVAGMARLTPIAAGAMTAAIAPVRHTIAPEAPPQALLMYVFHALVPSRFLSLLLTRTPRLRKPNPHRKPRLIRRPKG